MTSNSTETNETGLWESWKGEAKSTIRKFRDGLAACKGIIWSLWLHATLGMIPGLATYVKFSLDSPWADSADPSFQEIPGFGTGVGVVGSALAINMVFRINMAFSRWSEARDHLGKATAILRDMTTTVLAGTYEWTTLDKTGCYYQASAEQLELAEKELEARTRWERKDQSIRSAWIDTSRYHQSNGNNAGVGSVKSGAPLRGVAVSSGAPKHSSSSHSHSHSLSPLDTDSVNRTFNPRSRDAVKELCCQDVYWSSKGWFGVLVDVLKDSNCMEDGDHHVDTAMQSFGDMVAKGAQTSETFAHVPNVKGAKHKCNKVVVAHSILSSALRRAKEAKVLNHPEYKKVCEQMEDLLKSAYACLKVKTEPIPTPMTALTSVFLSGYTFVFPVYMAYASHEKLSRPALKLAFSLKPIPLGMYVLITMLVLLFFYGLIIIADQMDDPFGDDPFDIRLVELRNLLWGDIDTMDVAFSAIFEKQCRSYCSVSAGPPQNRQQQQQQQQDQQQIGHNPSPHFLLCALDTCTCSFRDVGPRAFCHLHPIRKADTMTISLGSQKHTDQTLQRTVLEVNLKAPKTPMCPETSSNPKSPTISNNPTIPKTLPTLKTRMTPRKIEEDSLKFSQHQQVFFDRLSNTLQRAGSGNTPTTTTNATNSTNPATPTTPTNTTNTINTPNPTTATISTNPKTLPITSSGMTPRRIEEDSLKFSLHQQVFFDRLSNTLQRAGSGNTPTTPKTPQGTMNTMNTTNPTTAKSSTNLRTLAHLNSVMTPRRIEEAGLKFPQHQQVFFDQLSNTSRRTGSLKNGEVTSGEAETGNIQSDQESRAGNENNE